MLKDIFSFVSTIITPITDLIDGLHTSDEERLKIKQQVHEANIRLGEQLLKYEADRISHQADIIKAEATGHSWLQRNWRPLIMVFFAVMLGSHWLGYTPENITQETLNHLFDLLKIGIGGYIVGRSAEKIIPQIIKKSNNENNPT